MVGLPARGKTYISKKLTRYLNWIGVPTKGEWGPRLGRSVGCCSPACQTPTAVKNLTFTYNCWCLWAGPRVACPGAWSLIPVPSQLTSSAPYFHAVSDTFMNVWSSQLTGKYLEDSGQFFIFVVSHYAQYIFPLMLGLEPRALCMLRLRSTTEQPAHCPLN